MIEIKSKKYYLSEPTMGEYRAILEFNHAISNKTSNQSILLRRLLEILPTIYKYQFTYEELTDAVEQGEIVYSNDFYKNTNNAQTNNINDFIGYGVYLVSKRQERIAWVYDTHTNLYETGDTESPKNNETDETHETKLRKVRRQLLKQYKKLIVENMIFTWTELDSMTVRAFVDFTVALDIDSKKVLKSKKDTELMEMLGVEMRGKKSKEVT